MTLRNFRERHGSHFFGKSWRYTTGPEHVVHIAEVYDPDGRIAADIHTRFCLPSAAAVAMSSAASTAPVLSTTAAYWDRVSLVVRWLLSTSPADRARIHDRLRSMLPPAASQLPTVDHLAVIANRLMSSAAIADGAIPTR